MTESPVQPSAPSTLCEAFQRTARHRPDQVALRTPGDEVTVTWREYAERVGRIAAGLAGLGVGRGETVALMLTNRPEFHLADTGALHAGATPFSVYNTLAADQLTYVLRDAGARVVVCEQQFVPKLLAVRGDTALEHVVCVDGRPEGTTTLAELEDAAEPGFDVEASWQAVTSEDVLTVIYTSGTTGPPKGVELTHANMLAEIAATSEVIPAGPDDRVVSYLPDAHVANRWGTHYYNMCTGMQITTVADAKAMIAALPDARPTFFGAVPQVWYKLKAAIEATLANEPNGTKRRLATWALEVGKRAAVLDVEGRPVSPGLALRHRIADALVLSKVRAKLGLDQVRIAASGAAPIAPEALEFVLGLGIPVHELWGMSETSSAATMNAPGAARLGTVGKPVRGMSARLADDGELLVRGPLVMKGYRNNPEKTAATIDADGWLHTGDIATIDDDGFVRIIDRKKELIINAAGKNMSPANIENAIRVACPMVGSAAAIGDNRPYVVALLALDPDAAAAYATEHGLADPSPAALATDPGVLAVLDSGIKAANEQLSRVEQIKKFAVVPTIWEPGGDELTPTMKLKRRPIAEKYGADIDALYGA